MPLPYIFWMIQIIWGVFFGAVFGGFVTPERATWGHVFIIFVQLTILGLKVFGDAVK